MCYSFTKLLSMKKLLNFLYKNGKYKTAIPTLIVGFILQGILISKYLPEFLIYSNNIKNPDQLFFYDLEYLKTLYQALGKEGRAFYAEMLGIDFLFTTISGFGYCLLLATLIKKRKWYIMIPLLLAISDVLENVSQLFLMNIFPDINSFVGVLSSLFSSIKMTFSIICIALILFFIAKNIYLWARTKIPR